MNDKASRTGKIYITIVFLLLYIPIVYLILYSFSKGTTMTNFQGFSLKHYGELFNDKRMLAIFLNTILIALLSSVCSTIIGTMVALAVHNAKRRHERETLLSLNSILLVLPRLDEMSPSMTNAAMGLGASPAQTLSKIILPYIQPGIIAGFFMAITYSLDDFAVTFFVTGNGFTTLSVEIYSRVRQGISLEINALAGIMFIFSLILVGVYYWIETRNTATTGKKSIVEVGDR